MPREGQKLRIAIVMLICVAIALYLFFYLSPASVPTLIVTTASSPTSQVAVGKLDDLPFPVRYSAVTSPEKLTPEQAQKIFRIAQACQTPAQPIWYVEVHCNKMVDGNPDLFCCSTVYFRPEPTTSRLREFNALYIDGGWLRYYKNSLPNFAPSKDANLPKPYQCVQVASADGNFCDDPATLPGNMEPFARPDGITNEDIIELVGFIRSSPGLSDAAPEPVTRPTTSSNDTLTLGGLRYPDKVEGANQIIRMQKKGDGSVEIYTVKKMSDKSSDAPAQTIICAKKGGKWMVLRISFHLRVF